MEHLLLGRAADLGVNGLLYTAHDGRNLLVLDESLTEDEGRRVAAELVDEFLTRSGLLRKAG